MRDISQSLHQLLCSSADWKSALESRLQVLKSEAGGPECARQAFELGQAFAHCVADREGAIASFVVCYRADSSRIDALGMAGRFARELCDFATLARLFHLQYKTDAVPEILAAEGIAWLDAGEPDRAIKPLSFAAAALPESQAVATALCTARREWTNVRQEMQRLEALAEAAPTREKAADALVQAARTIRMLGTDERACDGYLLAAFQQDPENLSALGMLEARLSQLEDQDAFLKVCEQRLANRKTPLALVDELRRTGLRLHEHAAYRGLGVRLLYRSVRGAHHHQLVNIPGHLAMISVLREHCQAANLLQEFLALIDSGLALPLPEIDLLFLSLQGLQVAWRLMQDEDSAAIYASIAARLAPEHPQVLEASRLLRTSPQEAALDSADSMIFLDQLNLPAPALELGPQVSLRDQLRAAAERAQPTPATQDLELQQETLPAAEVELEPALADEMELEPATADAVELDIDSDVELDLEPVGGVELPSVPVPASAALAPSPDTPALASETAEPKMPSNALGRISLIPASAMAALKTSSVHRNKVPAAPIDRAPRLTIPVTVEFMLGDTEYRAVTRDVSATGAFFVTLQMIGIEQVLDVVMLMPLDADALRTARVRLQARVVRAMPGGYGVLFLDVPPEFHSHLDRLLG